jgi:hypothetical protein
VWISGRLPAAAFRQRDAVPRQYAQNVELGCGWPIRTTIAYLPYRCVTPRSIHRTVPRRWEEWSEHLATLLAEGLESATVEADASACTNSAAKIAPWS